MLSEPGERGQLRKVQALRGSPEHPLTGQPHPESVPCAQQLPTLTAAGELPEMRSVSIDVTR